MRRCIFKASLNVSLVLRSMIHATFFFVKSQTGASKTVSFLKGNFPKFFPNVILKLFKMVQRFYGMWYALTYFSQKWKLEQSSMTILNWSRGLGKMINIFKKRLLCYRPIVFSKLFWMVCLFYCLWYKIPAFLLTI